MLEQNRVYLGDCIQLMHQLDEASVDAIVCDPPYGIGFMGKKWDTFSPEYIKHQAEIEAKRPPRPDGKPRLQAAWEAGRYDFSYKGMMGFQTWTTKWAVEALRILKPGGFLFVCGGTRTYHRMVCGIEDAGFTIKDTIAWAYASGFPKAQDIGKLIDKKAGAKREVIGTVDLHRGSPIARQTTENSITGWNKPDYSSKVDITLPSTPEAQKWSGWKTPALKPAYEPIVIAQKPCDGSITENMMKHGVGGFNVDECRIPVTDDDSIHAKNPHTTSKGSEAYDNTCYGKYDPVVEPFDTKQGRFPANIITTEPEVFGDGYDRFFFVPKAGKREKNEGLESFEEKDVRYEDGRFGSLEIFSNQYTEGSENPTGRGKTPKHKNIHPTVKPIKLFEHLLKLCTRENAIVLDPFLGSGTTAIACVKLNRRWIGFEQSEEYVKIAEARIKHYSEQTRLNEVIP